MAAPVKPESAPPAPSGTPIPTAAELEASRRQTIPPTPNPQSPPTEGQSVLPPTSEPTREQRLLAAQEQVLRDQSRQIAEMQGRLKKMETPPPPPVADLDRKFWESPTTAIQELIQNELKKTVDPINERLNGQASETAFDRAKKRLKEEYRDIWDKIEPSIDQWARDHSAGGGELNDQLIDLAALTASGAYYRGKLGNSPAPVAVPTPVSTPSPTPTPAPSGGIVTPPHLRPSAPVIPGHETPEKPQLRDLTENEKRLARERGQTPEQYLAWIDVKPEDVVKSKIGRSS